MSYLKHINKQEKKHKTIQFWESPIRTQSIALHKANKTTPINIWEKSIKVGIHRVRPTYCSIEASSTYTYLQISLHSGIRGFLPGERSYIKRTHILHYYCMHLECITSWIINEHPKGNPPKSREIVSTL